MSTPSILPKFTAQVSVYTEAASKWAKRAKAVNDNPDISPEAKVALIGRYIEWALADLNLVGEAHNEAAKAAGYSFRVPDLTK